MANSAEMITFSQFRPGIDRIEDVGIVPGHILPGHDQEMGVYGEMKIAFGYEGDNLEKFVGAVAPHPKLQENIEHAIERLSDPEVQKQLGQLGANPADIARDWSVRTGLQDEMFRSLMPDLSGVVPKKFQIGLEPDRVPNWMLRMADDAIIFARKYPVGQMILASSELEVGPAESADLKEEVKASSFMEETIKPHLESGLTRAEEAAGTDGTPQVFDGKVDLLKTGGKNGDEVMARAAATLAERGVVLATAKVIVFAVAGNGIQTGVQARKGFQSVFKDFDGDAKNRQLWIRGGSFPLGVTGEEPKETHQNPYSALGNDARGFKLLDDLVKR